MSVPGPLVAGWLSDRIGRRPVIVGVYLAGAGSIAAFVLAGDDVLRLWIGIVLLSAFSFVESPQLQALLADVTPRPLRDTAFATYFALAFGVGSLLGHRLRAAHRPRWVGQRPGARVLGHGRGVGAGGRRDPPDPDPAEGPDAADVTRRPQGSPFVGPAGMGYHAPALSGHFRSGRGAAW